MNDQNFKNLPPKNLGFSLNLKIHELFFIKSANVFFGLVLHCIQRENAKRPKSALISLVGEVLNTVFLYFLKLAHEPA